MFKGIVKGKGVYIILGVILVTALFLRIFSKEGEWVCTNGTWVKQGNTNLAQPDTACFEAKDDITQNFILEEENTSTAISTSSSTPTSTPVVTEEVRPVIISAPESGTLVSSPLVVKGQALGNWFFEANLPVKLVDDKGALIASTSGTAESDWMVSTFVPFSALLEFNTTATSGYLVIAKDNPSGLTENDASVSIPLKFLSK